MKMNRLTTILSVFLIGLVSAGWVIKDTVNPVEIYTGANTTPSISASTTGGVTVGPVGGLAAEYHTANGPWVLNSQATAGSVSNAFAMNLMSNLYYDSAGVRAIATATGYTQLRTLRQSTSGGEVFQIFVNYLDAQTAGAPVVTANDTKIIAATATGAWTIGANVGSLTHIVQSGSQTVLQVKGGGGAAANRGILQIINGAGTVVGTLLSPASGATEMHIVTESGGRIVFRDSSANETGIITNTGLWTFGAPGNTGTHSVNGRIKATRPVEVGGATTGGTFIGTYIANLTPGSAVTCSSTCSTQASANGFVASQAVCLAAWNSTTASTCGDTTNATKFCLCAGLD